MGQHVRVTLPDGSKREYASGTTIKQVAESIGKRLGK
ncbi:MAG: TGS domain-containing protein, partial [Clostridia bacterium]|nr:TGS domain-containing protein [Deltaproteobacteria bacterium]